jgi:hypothetical protein
MNLGQLTRVFSDKMPGRYLLAANRNMQTF